MKRIVVSVCLSLLFALWGVGYVHAQTPSDKSGTRVYNECTPQPKPTTRLTAASGTLTAQAYVFENGSCATNEGLAVVEGEATYTVTVNSFPLDWPGVRGWIAFACLSQSPCNLRVGALMYYCYAPVNSKCQGKGTPPEHGGNMSGIYVQIGTVIRAGNLGAVALFRCGECGGSGTGTPTPTTQPTQTRTPSPMPTTQEWTYWYEDIEQGIIHDGGAVVVSRVIGGTSGYCKNAYLVGIRYIARAGQADMPDGTHINSWSPYILYDNKWGTAGAISLMDNDNAGGAFDVGAVNRQAFIAVSVVPFQNGTVTWDWDGVIGRLALVCGNHNLPQPTPTPTITSTPLPTSTATPYGEEMCQLPPEDDGQPIQGCPDGLCRSCVTVLPSMHFTSPGVDLFGIQISGQTVSREETKICFRWYTINLPFVGGIDVAGVIGFCLSLYGLFLAVRSVTNTG